MFLPVMLAVLIPLLLRMIMRFDNVLHFPIDKDIAFIAIPCSLSLGYVFISASVWIYDFLKSRNIIIDEEGTIVAW